MSDHTAAPAPTALAEVISGVTDVPAGQLTGATRFDTLGHWNSFAALRLLTAVEEHFAIKLDLRTYLRTETVDGLAALIGAAAGGRQR
ncbi:acyl carrier protein [Streptomyces sp. RS10V-4]|uniref:acyl carrier protein n=1 Tax=Streptomyces rhizoryzae TaxID=2932493 RepID=UPI00200612CC|nr:acyl carrier protein [Streptomyces rhizoryzae]MCK7621801.1 acyl carrier protein [Streptomyces rhizoryzae]